MASETRSYPNVNRAKIDALRAEVAAFVQLPPGDAATIESHGVKGRFVFDADSKVLAITLDEVPFFIPRSAVWNAVERALRAD